VTFHFGVSVCAPDLQRSPMIKLIKGFVNTISDANQ
jgi:hypothetical protein